jgi:hypothetical protein
MRINASLKKVPRKQVKQICKIVVNWCTDHLGQNCHVKKDLKIEIIYNNPVFEGYAEYYIDEDYRIIRIFMDFNNTIKQLISSILHEFTHDLQPVQSKYDKLQKKYGYRNHPLEKQARRMEDRFTDICWDDIKHKVEKLFDK